MISLLFLLSSWRCYSSVTFKHLSVQWVLAVEENWDNRCWENWSAVWTFVWGKGLCKDIFHHFYSLLWTALHVEKDLMQIDSPYSVSSPQRVHFLHGSLFYWSPLIPGLCLKRGLPTEGDKRERGEGILVGWRHRKRIYERKKSKKEENSCLLFLHSRSEKEIRFFRELATNKWRLNAFITTVAIKSTHSPRSGVRPAKPICSPSSGSPNWGSSARPPISQSDPVEKGRPVQD